ncbi:hypothetical protein [Geoalkalibacter halelectricus]|uniref:hypothetical protein n=1 Tax=Geoalkalibacter halelectricus TaxID=2847045 RepID=UPI00266FEEC7|nr:hypothetical protein [Geoalkalibacter halelectricus]MDO3380374.1 hypothetical protein [Geoalkalibacter halelectricus]
MKAPPLSVTRQCIYEAQDAMARRVLRFCEKDQCERAKKTITNYDSYIKHLQRFEQGPTPDKPTPEPKKKATQLLFDGPFYYPGHDGTMASPGMCRMRVIRGDDDTITLIASESQENKGPSITGAAHALWQTALERFDQHIPQHQIPVLVEHYGELATYRKGHYQTKESSYRFISVELNAHGTGMIGWRSIEASDLSLKGRFDLALLYPEKQARKEVTHLWPQKEKNCDAASQQR